MADTKRLPGPNTDVWDWQLEGSCRGMNSSFFFHPENERGQSRRRREERAKAVCRTCPVIDRCREHALAVEEPYGVWGGLGEGERQLLIAQHRREVRLEALDQLPRQRSGSTS